MPNDGIYHPAAREAEIRIKQALESLLAFCDLHESVLSRHPLIYEVVQNIRDSSDPTASYEQDMKVALVGPSGAGKSELSGQLHGKQRAVITNPTSRGTYVPILWCKSLPDQQTPYQVTYTWCDEEQRRALLVGYLLSIAEFLTLSNVSTQRLDQDGTTLPAESQEEAQQDANALSELKPHFDKHIDAVFSVLCDPDHGDFCDREHMIAWLSRKFELLSAADVAEELAPHLTNMLADSAVTSAPAASEAHLRQHIKNMSMRPQDLQRAHPSLFLRSCSVHCTASDLAKWGITLADTGGVTDFDEHVVQLTNDFLADCNMILAVLDVKRWEERLPKMNTVFQTAINANKKFIPIFTHSDTFERIRPQDVADSEYLLPDEKLQLQSIDEHISRLKTEAPSDLSRQLTTLRLKRRDVEIAIGSKTVRAEYLSAISEMFRIEDIPEPIFVSSTEYRRHCEPDDFEQPSMSIAATGIPELARLLYDRIGHQNFDKLQDSVSVLPRQLRKLIRVVTKCNHLRHASFRDKVDQALQAGRQRIQATHLSVYNLLQDLEAVFRTQNASWVQSAQVLVHNWRNGAMRHATIFRSYCRKEGDHKPCSTSKNSYTAPQTRAASKAAETQGKSWNSQIQDIMAEDVKITINSMLRSINDSMKQADDQIVEEFAALHRTVSGLEGIEDDGTTATSRSPFLAKVEKRRESARAKATQWFNSVEEAIRSLERNLIQNTSNKSYVAEVMRPAHDKAAKHETEKLFDENQKPVRRGEAARARKAHNFRGAVIEKAVVGMDVDDEKAGKVTFMPGLRQAVIAQLKQELDAMVQAADKMWEKRMQNLADDFNESFKVSDGDVLGLDDAIGLELAEKAESALQQLEGPVMQAVMQCRGTGRKGFEGTLGVKLET